MKPLVTSGRVFGAACLSRRFFLLCALLPVVTGSLSACVPPGVNRYYTAGSVNKHVWPKGFRNAEVEEALRKSGLMVWLWHMLDKDQPYAPGRVPPDLDKIRRPDPLRIQATWIGHATYLVQMNGVNILTDPMFSDYASPFPVTSLKRKAPPGLSMEQLPKIDIVVISHNHYDHLDAGSIRKLGADPVYFVPLGLASWMRGHGAKAVYEMDWEHTAKILAGDAQVCVTSAPAQHFSGRTAFDRNQTLWSGWVIESGNARVYFAGDTGYMRKGGFREFGARMRGIDVGMVPIGAYNPEKELKNVHAAPEEAVKIAEDMRVRVMLPMHWGTFRLTSEPMEEPGKRYLAAAAKAGYAKDQAPLPRIGETVTVIPDSKVNPCRFDSYAPDEKEVVAKRRTLAPASSAPYSPIPDLENASPAVDF